MTITLYDFPVKAGVPWNPNVMKARIALNYKGIDFKTEWIEYPDVERTLKALGAPPTEKKPDGADMYTLPAIHDSATGKVIVESYDIAVYLDEQYPDKPTLFPGQSRAAIAAFNHVWMNTAFANMWPLVMGEFPGKMNPPSEEYFRRTRESWFNVKLDEWCPPGPKRVEQWEKVKADFSTVAAFLDRNGNQPWFLGDTFSYADAIAAGFVSFVKFALRDEKEWAAVAEWNGGRWAKLVEGTAKLRV